MGGEQRNYITSDEYFMTIAKLAGMRSKETLHVGTCVVDGNNRILSIGCNGMSDTYSETVQEFLTENTGSDFEDTIDKKEKDKFSDDTDDIRLYISVFPSKELVGEIIHSKIGVVIYDEDSSDSLSAIISDRLLRSAGIRCRRYRKTGKMLAFAV